MPKWMHHPLPSRIYLHPPAVSVCHDSVDGVGPLNSCQWVAISQGTLGREVRGFYGRSCYSPIAISLVGHFFILLSPTCVCRKAHCVRVLLIDVLVIPSTSTDRGFPSWRSIICVTVLYSCGVKAADSLFVLTLQLRD